MGIRERLRGGAAAAALALLLAGCMRTFSLPIGAAESGTQGSVPGGPAPGQDAPQQARAVADLVNRHRATVGCGALVWDERAAAAAQAHSDDMARHDRFSHIGSDGSDAGSRLERAGVRWRAVAENIALNGGGASSAVQGWLNSRGHRQNIENCGYTHHGVGLRGDRWTHVFFTPPT